MNKKGPPKELCLKTHLQESNMQMKFPLLWCLFPDRHELFVTSHNCDS